MYKKIIRNAILIFTETTIFLSAFGFCFGFLCWFCGFILVVCYVGLSLYSYKDREINISWCKVLL